MGKSKLTNVTVGIRIDQWEKLFGNNIITDNGSKFIRQAIDEKLVREGMKGGNKL